MQTDLRAKLLGSGNSGTRWILACLGSLGILFLLSGGLVSVPMSTASSLQYHNVQIFLQTQSQDGNMYTLTAYESNGTLISSSQSQYPAFSLELPSGTYLFAASVVNKSSGYWWYYSTSEYGYQLAQISSDVTINLQTRSLANIPTSKVTVEAQFVNGTAMSGASVYASVIGMSYWSKIYGDQGLALWNQTSSNGVATLTVPSLPVEVTAWNWIQVNLPSNETTVQKNIGGQEINVTVYWQPMYVGLSGSAVIIPPQNSAQITLNANQEPNYWMYAQGTSYEANPSTGPGGYPVKSVANSPSPVPAQVSSAQQQFSPGGPTQYSNAPPQYLPPNQIPNLVPVTQPTPGTNDLLIAAIVAAVGLACASFVVMVLGRGRRHGQVSMP